MSEVNCISRNPYRKGLDKYLVKPFKDGSADLRIVLQPLSLFSTQQPLKDSCKDFPETKLEKYEMSDNGDIHDNHCLMECVAEKLRLKQDHHHPYLSFDDQQEFITVLLNGVSRIVQNIEEQINNNPSLSVAQIKKFNSKMHQPVIHVCDFLFTHYCHKAQVLYEKGIFSGTANLCRLRTQLLFHVDKIFTIQGVKQMFMNTKDSKKEDSLGKMKEGFRIIEQTPSINLAKLIPVSLNPLSEMYKQEKKPNLPKTTDTDEKVAPDVSESCFPLNGKTFMFVRRCESQPQLSYSETIWDEMEIEKPTLRRSYSLENGNCTEFLTTMEQVKQMDSNNDNSHSSSRVNQDLKTLLRIRSDDPELNSLFLDDIPPLIKAVPQDEKRRKAREKLEKQIQELYEREKVFLEEKNSYEILEPLYDQPTTLTTEIDETTIRTTDARPSKRIKHVNHHLVSKSPQYNDLKGEINMATIKDFDRPIFEETELAKVYDRFLNSIENEEVFDSDTTYADVGTDLTARLSIQNRNKHILNKQLCLFEHPPWHETTYDQWVLQPQTTFTVNHENIHPRIPNVDQSSSRQTKEMKYWRHWWNNIVRVDDYLKCLSLQETDFLSTIFHLYEDERKKEKKKKEGKEKLEKKRKKQQRNILPWEKDSGQEIEATDSNIPGEWKAFDISQYQQRFNKMWKFLQMTQEQKIEMAIRFSMRLDGEEFETALEDWEEATKLINRRECIMASLMTFESEASDPNRFFVRETGNTRARLDEAKCRSSFYQKIEQVDKKLSKHLSMIKKKYGEVVTFQERPYLEKMKWDRIEMLHWLQEVRKLNAIHYESKQLQMEMPDMSFNDLLMEFR